MADNTMMYKIRAKATAWIVIEDTWDQRWKDDKKKRKRKKTLKGAGIPTYDLIKMPQINKKNDSKSQIVEN